ncbi:MAG: hypothetical protein RXQ97_02215 [Caldivirga sp.]
MLTLALTVLTLGLLKAPVVYLYDGGGYLLAITVNFTSISQYSQVFIVNSTGWFNVSILPNGGRGVLITNTYQYGDWVYLTGFSPSSPLLIGLRLVNAGMVDVVNLTHYLPINLQPYALAVVNDTIYVFGVINGYASALLVNPRSGVFINLTGLFKGEWASSTPVSAAVMPNGTLLLLALSSSLTPLLGSLSPNGLRTVTMPQVKGLPLGLYQFNDQVLIPVMTIRQSQLPLPSLYFSGITNSYVLGSILLYYVNGSVVNYTSCINPNAVIFDVYWINSTAAILGGGIVNGAVWEPYIAVLNVRRCESLSIPMDINGVVFAVAGNWVGGGLNVIYNITTLSGSPFIAKINYAMSISNLAHGVIPTIYFSPVKEKTAITHEVLIILTLIAGLIILTLLMLRVR